MVRLLIVLFLTCHTTFGEKEVNLTTSEKSENIKFPGKSVNIPLSSETEEEDIESSDISLETILQKSKEFDEATTPDIPYLPLIQRCSIDSDCSSETACYDGKCINATRNQLFPYLFKRCQTRLDCPSGHRCIISMCVPFRW